MTEPTLLKDKPKIWLVSLLAFAIIALNIIDAVATLFWIKLGVTEANPFMAYIIQYDTGLFIALKTLGITAAVAFLVYYAAKRYAIALYGMWLLMLVYLVPLAIHVFMYTHTSFL